MYRKQLVAHVVSELEAGKKDADIKTELKSDGWPQSDIKDAFYYGMYPEKLRHFSIWRFLDSEVHVYIAFLLIGISLSLFSLAFIEYRNEENNYSVFLAATPSSPNQIFKYGEQPALSNPAFFEQVKNQFMADKVNFIEVDLSKMVARVYKDGAKVAEEKVLTKGRPGSWWETPAGLYKISSKEATHYSSMGGVYMPWSMNFQGNFYIHGWPYYAGGKEVASTYSGGCIRLSTASAKVIYNLVQNGTPILVHEKDFAADSFGYSEAIPALSAKHYLAADLSNNFVFLKHDGEPAPIASITKLVTALVAAEYINLDEEIIVNKSDLASTSKPRLLAGQKLSVYQLLFPLLLESSNEAAAAIASVIGKTRFVDLMNDKAASIGMGKTRFADASGASAGNISTTDDLFMLAKYIYNNRSFIWDISGGKLKQSAYGKSYWSDLRNFNDFSGDESFVGGKVGETTAAKDTALYVFKLNFGGEDRPIVVILLGSDDRKADAEKIVEYIRANYRADVK